jgi:hypothetical protein
MLITRRSEPFSRDQILTTDPNAQVSCSLPAAIRPQFLSCVLFILVYFALLI